MALLEAAFGAANSKKIYDETYTFRIYDAKGDVTKFKPLTPEPCDDTTGDPTRFTATVVEAGTGDSVTVNSQTAGSYLTLTTAANEYDGINLQAKSESFKLVANKPLYFGAKIAVSDATQLDLLIGLCETKTDLLKTSSAHGITATNVEGVFFVKVDGGTSILAKTYKDGAETNTAAYGTAMGTSGIIYEIVWDGSQLSFYVDGAIVATFTSGLPDGDLCISLNVRAGEAVAKTAEVSWIRCFQAQS